MHGRTEDVPDRRTDVHSLRREKRRGDSSCEFEVKCVVNLNLTFVPRSDVKTAARSSNLRTQVKNYARFNSGKGEGLEAGANLDLQGCA